MGGRVKDGIFPFLKKNFMLIIIGVIAVILLLLSGDMFSSGKAAEENSKEFEQDYAKATEQDLKSFLEKIEGVGVCKVLINIECGYEYVYAKDVSGSDKSDHVIVSNTPVVVKKILPKISGVAIVCQGGGSAEVKTRITDMVSTLLNIPKSKITVTK